MWDLIIVSSSFLLYTDTFFLSTDFIPLQSVCLTKFPFYHFKIFRRQCADTTTDCIQSCLTYCPYFLTLYHTIFLQKIIDMHKIRYHSAFVCLYETLKFYGSLIYLFPIRQYCNIPVLPDSLSLLYLL